MLRIFQNIRPASALWVLLVGLLMRLPLLLMGNVHHENMSLNIMQNFFTFVNQNDYIAILGGLLLVFLQSIVFNKLCIDHDVLYHHSYLPAYFFMLMNSVYKVNLFLNPMMFVNLFVLMALLSMFRMYQSGNSSVILFYTALFFGCASLLLPIMYSGIVFLIAGTIIFKNITIKDLLALFSGYTLPALMLWGILFLFGYHYVLPEIRYSMEFKLSTEISIYISLLIIVFITTMGLLKNVVNYTKNNIKTRRISLFMIAHLAFSAIVVLSRFAEFTFYFPLMAFTISILISYFMLGSKGRRLKEFLHYILLLSILFSIYYDQIQ